MAVDYATQASSLYPPFMSHYMIAPSDLQTGPSSESSASRAIGPERTKSEIVDTPAYPPYRPSVPSTSQMPTPTIRVIRPKLTDLPSDSPPRQMAANRRLVSHLKQPRVLAGLIAHLEWLDFLSLSSSCRDLFQLFDIPAFKDVILSRFVPGYRACLQSRNLSRYNDVPTSLHDLHVLSISRKVPLHRYPTHALAILSSAQQPSWEQHLLSQRLAALTQAHSRFVLLLQSNVHSSILPIEPETDMITYKSHLSYLKPGIRELKFPPPLSYSQSVIDEDLMDTPSRPARPGLGPSHNSTSSIPALRSRLQKVPHPSVRSLSSMAPVPLSDFDGSHRTQRKRKLTIFGRRTRQAPPPPSEPRTLKYYSSSWRHTLFHTSGGFTSDDDETAEFGMLHPPKRSHKRFASVATSSETSSLSSPSPSPLSRHSMGDRSPRVANNSNISRMTSPHDLSLATSRTRAPILRVYVPCSDLLGSVQACTDQLVDSGLWDHLSTGDIICNLGYVPPSDDGGSISDDGEIISFGRRQRSRSSDVERKWLLFNGECLVLYSPPDALPLVDPLSLPSPFYYAHIMPPHVNPTLLIGRLPPCDDIPQMRLLHVHSKVRSPHSPTGYAVASKYAWTARIIRGPDPADLMGDGWLGEWVLEGEGTKEGRQALLECLQGYEVTEDVPPRQWELVTGKCGGGRIWLRLLNTYQAPNPLDDIEPSIGLAI